MANPSFRATAETFNDGSTGGSITLPTHVAGDLIVLKVANSGAGITVDVSPGSGDDWTLQETYSTPADISSGASALHVRVYTKVAASGSETATLTLSSSRAWIVIGDSYSNASYDGTTFGSSGANPSSLPMVAPTPTLALGSYSNSFYQQPFCAITLGNFATYPSGYTLLNEQSGVGPGGDEIGLAVTHKLESSATAPGSFNSPNEATYIVATTVVRSSDDDPASAPTGTPNSLQLAVKVAQPIGQIFTRKPGHIGPACCCDDEIFECQDCLGLREFFNFQTLEIFDGALGLGLLQSAQDLAANACQSVYAPPIPIDTCTHLAIQDTTEDILASSNPCVVYAADAMLASEAGLSPPYTSVDSVWGNYNFFGGQSWDGPALFNFTANSSIPAFNSLSAELVFECFNGVPRWKLSVGAGCNWGVVVCPLVTGGGFFAQIPQEVIDLLQTVYTDWTYTYEGVGFINRVSGIYDHPVTGARYNWWIQGTYTFGRIRTYTLGLTVDSVPDVLELDVDPGVPYFDPLGLLVGKAKIY